jgi:hypothetical protein
MATSSVAGTCGAAQPAGQRRVCLTTGALALAGAYRDGDAADRSSAPAAAHARAAAG